MISKAHFPCSIKTNVCLRRTLDFAEEEQWRFLYKMNPEPHSFWISSEVEERYTKIVSMSKQLASTTWEQVEHPKLSWAELWGTKPLCTTFLMESVHHVFPNLTILHTWDQEDTQSANCEGGEAPWSTSWASALRLLGSAISTPKSLGEFYLHSNREWKDPGGPEAGSLLDQSKKEGKPPAQLRRGAPTIATGSSSEIWKGNPSSRIIAPSLGQDMVLTVVATKQLVLLERKKTKYPQLIVECRGNGW